LQGRKQVNPDDYFDQAYSKPFLGHNFANGQIESDQNSQSANLTLSNLASTNALHHQKLLQDEQKTADKGASH
jgi:hypothetical protein